MMTKKIVLIMLSVISIAQISPMLRRTAIRQRQTFHGTSTILGAAPFARYKKTYPGHLGPNSSENTSTPKLPLFAAIGTGIALTMPALHNPHREHMPSKTQNYTIVLIENILTNPEINPNTIYFELDHAHKKVNALEYCLLSNLNDLALELIHQSLYPLAIHSWVYEAITASPIKSIIEEKVTIVCE